MMMTGGWPESESSLRAAMRRATPEYPIPGLRASQTSGAPALTTPSRVRYSLAVLVLRAIAVAALTVPASARADAPGAEPGFRLSLGGGVAIPLGDFASERLVLPSPRAMARGGYELMWGRIGLTPQARVEYIQFANDFEKWSETGNDVRLSFFHFDVGFRFAGHVGRAAPFAELGLGVDISTIDRVYLQSIGDLGPSGGDLGMHMGFGVDVALTKGWGIGVMATIHPGFTAFAIAEDYYGSTFEGADVAYFAVDFVVNAGF